MFYCRLFFLLKYHKLFIYPEPKELFTPKLDRFTPGMMLICDKNLGGEELSYAHALRHKGVTSILQITYIST